LDSTHVNQEAQPTCDLGYTAAIGPLKRIARAATRLAGLGAGDLELREETLALPHWSQTLRVAVVADVHAGSPQVNEERLDEIVALVNRADVDLVALLGDYIDPEVALGKWIEPEAIAARLARMRSRLGTYAVLGNHDWGHAGARMGAALREAGITVLEDEVVHLSTDSGPPAAGRSGRGFWIAGIADLMAREPDLDGTLAKIPHGEPVLLLSHNPDVFPHVPGRVALTLSGHTHGAQVDIPVIREKTTPSEYGARYTGGHIEEGGRHLYVSDGIGTSRFPVRFRAKPVIPVLELR
jgi:uncharacterized protein